MASPLPVLILLGAFAVAWLVLLTRLDTHRHTKRSAGIPALFFVLGLLSLPLTRFLYSVAVLDPGATGGGLALLWKQILVVGLTEELAKFLIFAVAASLLRSIKEPRDGMLQAAAVALAFATGENYGYAMLGGLPLLLFRSVITAAGHMVYAAIWGYHFSLVYFGISGSSGRRYDYRPILLSLAAVMLLHGLFNYFAIIGLEGLSYLLDVIGLAAAVVFLSRTAELSPFFRYPLREYRTAIPRLRRALSVQPDSYVLHRRIALYYLYAANDDSRAIRYAQRHFHRCSRLAPKQSFPQVFHAICRIYDGYSEEGYARLRELRDRLSREHRQRLERHVTRLLRESSERHAVIEALRGG